MSLKMILPPTFHFQNFSRVLIGFQTSLAKCLPVILKLNMIKINPSLFFSSTSFAHFSIFFLHSGIYAFIKNLFSSFHC